MLRVILFRIPSNYCDSKCASNDGPWDVLTWEQQFLYFIPGIKQILLIINVVIIIAYLWENGFFQDNQWILLRFLWKVSLTSLLKWTGTWLAKNFECFSELFELLDCASPYFVLVEASAVIEGDCEGGSCHETLILLILLVSFVTIRSSCC